MREHFEIPVKVKAYVDEGIASLVLALNEYENIITVDSCQGGDGEEARVSFTYHGETKRFFQRVEWLAQRIARSLDEGWRLNLEWFCGDTPMANLYCDPQLTDRLAATVSRIVRDEITH